MNLLFQPALFANSGPLWKPLSAVAVAALVAGAITGFPGVDPAKATDTAQVTKAALAAPAADTSDRGWPYRSASNVRVVTIDKMK